MNPHAITPPAPVDCTQLSIELCEQSARFVLRRRGLSRISLDALPPLAALAWYAGSVLGLSVVQIGDWLQIPPLLAACRRFIVADLLLIHGTSPALRRALWHLAYHWQFPASGREADERQHTVVTLDFAARKRPLRSPSPVDRDGDTAGSVIVGAFPAGPP